MKDGISVFTALCDIAGWRETDDTGHWLNPMTCPSNHHNSSHTDHILQLNVSIQTQHLRTP